MASVKIKTNNMKTKKKSKNSEWILSAYEKELLIKQVTEVINEFTPDACKKKEYKYALDKTIAYNLNRALTVMAILNSASGLNIEPIIN
jgi:tRNA U38,U39,U40 pseudouridine synthase TruA